MIISKFQIFNEIYDLLKQGNSINELKNGNTYFHKLLYIGDIMDSIYFEFFHMLDFDFNLKDKNNISILYFCLCHSISIPNFVLKKIKPCKNSLYYIIKNKAIFKLTKTGILKHIKLICELFYSYPENICRMFMRHTIFKYKLIEYAKKIFTLGFDSIIINYKMINILDLNYFKEYGYNIYNKIENSINLRIAYKLVSMNEIYDKLISNLVKNKQIKNEPNEPRYRYFVIKLDNGEYVGAFSIEYLAIILQYYADATISRPDYPLKLYTGPLMNLSFNFKSSIITNCPICRQTCNSMTEMKNYYHDCSICQEHCSEILLSCGCQPYCQSCFKKCEYDGMF